MQIRETFSLPYASLGGVKASDATSKVFLAHAGLYAHLHFDVDGRAVLLSQVFGHKRVMLIPPERSQILDPLIDERAGNFSSRFIQNLDSEEKLAFARAVGAYDTWLGPGDTIFIPTAWWHYVDYLDTGMSINVRLGRTALQQQLTTVADALASRHVHLWQMSVQPFATGRVPSRKLVDLAETLLEKLSSARSDPNQIPAFAAALNALYRAVSPDTYRRVLYGNDQNRFEAIDALYDKKSPSLVPSTEWSPDDVPRLRPGVEIASIIGSEALVVLRERQAQWRIAS